MEHDAVRLVQLANEAADFRAHYAFQRNAFRPDDVHLEPARAQRCRDFEADEARADDQRPLRRRRSGDDGAAVGKRAQVVDLRIRRARDFEADGIGAGRDQQRAELVLFAVLQMHRLCSTSIDDTRESSTSSMLPLGVILGRAQRYPVVLRGSRQEILRQVGPIARWRRVGADHRDGTCIAFPAENVRGGQPGRAAADDDHGGRNARGLGSAARDAARTASRARRRGRRPSRLASMESDRARARAAPRRCAG